MVNIFVIGAGAWGTAISNLLARNENNVNLWAFEKDVVNFINETSCNKTYLPNVKLDANINAVNDFRLLSNSRAVFLVTPCQLTENILKNIAKSKQMPSDIPIIICSKGIVNKDNELLSNIIKKYFNNPILVMSGPNFAEEVALGKSAITTIASKDDDIANYVANLLNNKYFKTVICDDIISTQISGSVKNVVAIALGIAAGLELSESSKAAILTKGLNEIGELSVKLGGNKITMLEPCAVGDLVLTCLSNKSRNMSLGYELGKGSSLEKIMSDRKTVAEGVATAKSAYELSVKYNIKLDLITLIYNILYKNYKVSVSDFLF
ncbi:MAG: NAD(P)H-dependent glycerol-3-phosphate dehydrogenase [Rickettsiales bacterium]|nr:NAD(P)H-dependent glycerol-3-phosphate dehydrogenase [Rickettsiales bacterium]